MVAVLRQTVYVELTVSAALTIGGCGVLTICMFGNALLSIAAY